MPDWNTRLVIMLGDQPISPIDNFTPTFNTPHTILHSVDADNVGLIRQPFTFTFTMTVKAIGTVVADLTELALNGSQFNIAVAEKTGTDWTFKSIKFNNCVITSASPSNIVIDGVPTASFNCTALNVNLEA
jgi:hypothetical protein